MPRLALLLAAVFPTTLLAAEPPLPPGAVARIGNTQFLHPEPVTHVLLSTDGAEVATVGKAALRWWKVADGTVASEPFKGTQQKFHTPIFSADNSTLVQVEPTAGFGSILAVLDPRTGKARHHITVADNVGLTGLRVSHTGKWAVGFGGKTVVVWDLTAGKKADSFEAAGVRRVAVSDDGKRVALDIDFHKTEVRTAAGELVWEVTKDYPPPAKDQPVRENLESHEALAFSPDGKRLATTGIIATAGHPFPAPVRMWDVENKKHVWAEYVGERALGRLGREVRFTPDGKHLSTANGNLYLLDADTGKLAHEFPADAGITGNYSIANDGSRVAMAAGRKLRLWETATHKELEALVGPRDPARLIARSPDGRYTATGSGAHDVWVWDARGGTPHAVRASDGYWAFDLGFSPDSKRLLTTTRGESPPVRVWDAGTGKQLFNHGHLADKLHRAAFSRHGLLVVIDYVPHLCDPDTGKLIWSGDAVPKYGNNEPLVVISPTAECYVTDAGVFSVQTGKELAKFDAGFPLAVSDDAKRVVYKTKDGKIAQYDTAAKRSGEPVTVGAVYAVSPAADRAAVVVGLSLQVFDLTTGKKVAECERPAAVKEDVWVKWWARGVKFSPDGTRVVAHADTPGLGVWAAATGKSEAWFVPDVDLPLSAFTVPDAKTAVATYGHGDLIYVWQTGERR